MSTRIVNLDIVNAGGEKKRVDRSSPGRDNALIEAKLSEVSKIRFHNITNAEPGAITVEFQAVGAEPSPFGQVPEPLTLQAKAFFDFDVIRGGSLKYVTTPSTPDGGDHTDIHIDC